VLLGHDDTVRALALLPGVGLVSASHDATLRIWSQQGQCVRAGAAAPCCMLHAHRFTNR
jgi:hypothetical protein